MNATDVDSQLRIAPRGGALGADVAGIDFAVPFSPDQVAVLMAALARHKVLFFRDQDITSAQQIARGKQFGELEIHPFTREKVGGAIFADPLNPELVVVESRPERPSVAEQWHSDTTWRECPSLGSILRMTHRPDSGGRTMWADMAAAYQGLDDRTRHLIDDAVAVHDSENFRNHLRRGGASEAQIADLATRYPPVEHPVVRTHRVTGERAIFVNTSFTLLIKGMSESESRDTLQHLYRQAENPDYQVAIDWEPGDIAFWDNRSTQHAVTGDVVGHRRLERVTLVGDRPV